MFVSCAVIIKHMIGGLHLVFFIYTRPYNYTGGTHGQAHTHIIYKRYTNNNIIDNNNNNNNNNIVYFVL